MKVNGQYLHHDAQIVQQDHREIFFKITSQEIVTTSTNDVMMMIQQLVTCQGQGLPACNLRP